MDPDRFGEIGLDQLCAVYSKTRRWFSDLVKRGWIKQATPGKYTLREVIAGVEAYREDQGKRRHKTTSQSDLQSERAKMLRLKREHLAGTLMLVAEHEAIADEAIGIVRSALSSLPSKISNDPAVRHQTEQFIDEAMANASACFAKKAAEPDPTIDADGDDAKDDAG